VWGAWTLKDSLEVIFVGLEKLNINVGSTPEVPDMNEFGLEVVRLLSLILLAANDANVAA
jgi:hypothetical protein